MMAASESSEVALDAHAVGVRVTEIRQRRGRVTISFDGASPLECDRSFELTPRLAVGDSVDPQTLDQLRRCVAIHTAKAIAEKLLTRRPRSEAELLTRLKQRAVQPAVAKEAVASLREQGLIDDAAFARYWAEERIRGRPRAARMIQAELGAKGVAPDIAVAATAQISDDELATQLARKAAQRFQGNWPAYERRGGAMLIRRGFSYEVARRALRSAWESREGTGDTEAR